MKIAVITQYYKPEMGAPQNRLFEMCAGLKQLGAVVSIVTAMPNYPTGKIFDAYRGRFVCDEKVDDIPVRRYWLYASNSRKVLPRIWNMISFSIMVLCSLRYLRKQKNDIIIVESPPLTLAVSAWLLAKCTRTKLILNVSDLWPLSAMELGAISKDGLTYRCLAWLERWLYQHADACLGQSQEIVDYIASHGAKKTYLFRNGVNPERFRNNQAVSPEPNDKLQIVYTGLLGYAQGILDLCRNVDFASLNAEFHIYGAGGEQEPIEQYVTENHKGITYHGKVSREDIPTVLVKYDCTLIPLVKNIYGAVPSKIYESMAAGLPILFAGEGEGARIVLENELGWVSKSKDFDMLSQNILAATNQMKREEIRSHCIDCANSKFNRPQQIGRLYDFLQQLVIQVMS